MGKAIIGRKAGMTQIFDADGKVVPVTVIEAGPCTVTQIKTAERDGYDAVQIGYETTKEKHLTKPEIGHLRKAGGELKRHLKEFPIEGEYKPGDEIKADVFAEGDRVDITGISKGKGFAGVIKRHGAHRGPTSHGGGPTHRHQGSMGANSDPSRVFPGKMMPGRMGGEQVTITNLDVVKVDLGHNLIAVRGAIPGPRNGIVYVRTSVKNV